MLEFNDIQISDKNWIKDVLKISNYNGCEYSFANNFAWSRLSDSKICNYKGFYVIATDEPSFIFPAGDGNYSEVLSEMRAYANSKGKPLKITNAVNDIMPILVNFGDFELIETPENWDYVYNSDDLINLPGKKYANKRNHLNNFFKYNWEYKNLECGMFNECIAFSAVTYNQKSGWSERGSMVEQFAIHRFFEHFSAMGLHGGTLWVDNELVAFTIGEQLNSDTYCIHIEKANINYHGSYAAINNLFAKENINTKYVNREEDMGVDGLRKSKKSYYPCYQIQKNIVIFR